MKLYDDGTLRFRLESLQFTWRSWPVYCLWPSKLSINEWKRYMWNLFSHWLIPCSAIDRKRALVSGVVSRRNPLPLASDIQINTEIWLSGKACDDMAIRSFSNNQCKLRNFHLSFRLALVGVFTVSPQDVAVCVVTSWRRSESSSGDVPRWRRIVGLRSPAKEHAHYSDVT